MLASLGACRLTDSLSIVVVLYPNAGFNDETKFGLLQKLYLDRIDLSRFLMFCNPFSYAGLLNSIRSLAFAKDSCTPSTNTETLRMVLRRPDVE